MRITPLLVLGGLCCALLSLPAAAQERGPGPAPRAEGQPQRPGAFQRPHLDQARLEAARERLRERFQAERAELLRRHQARAGAGRDAAPQGPRGPARPAAPQPRGAGPALGRPDLERILERARHLPPHEQLILRQRLTAYLRAQRAEGGAEPQRRPLQRPEARPGAQPRRAPLVRPGQRPQAPQRFQPQEGQRRAPQLQRQQQQIRRPAPAPAPQRRGSAG